MSLSASFNTSGDDGRASSDDTNTDTKTDVNMNMNMNTMADEPTPPSPTPTPTPTPMPRLMITKMVLENFKSYAGTKTIGPFHKCFSSVVGPNGSGKSNVIDAMLFVFGKRAKKLRLNKVSELIHKSENYKDLKYAKVSVYFQEIIDTAVPVTSDSGGTGSADTDTEDNDYTIVPNSQIVVSRIAKSDNSSHYKLNERNVSFKQVSTYLSSKGIDLDNNRFLILQGEVEMISMMPPKAKKEGDDDGLLEYLEDIIGSNAFVEDTVHAEQKVEELTEVRQEKLNRVKAVEVEKNGLRNAKLEAEALITKQRDIRKKQNILHQLSLLSTKREKVSQRNVHTTLTTQLNNERTKLHDTETHIQKLERGYTQQTQDYEEAHAQLIQTKEEFTKYERRDIQIREEMKHVKSSLKKLQSKVKKESSCEIKMEEKVRDAKDMIPVLEESIEDLTMNKQTQDELLEKIFEESKGMTEQLRHELECKTTEMAPVTQQRAVYQSALDTAQTEVKLLQDSTSRAKERVVDAERELSIIDSKQESLKKRIVQCETLIKESKDRIDVVRREDEGLVQDEKALAKRHAEFTARAEESKAAMQAGVHRSKAVKGILKAASEHGSDLHNIGILGRLGDLATIPEQYDVAISTSCGYLDHIVVRTTHAAQKCLQFLRHHNLGRANFIPLDKMRKGLHDRHVDTPENAPRLYDLISPSNHMITPALHLGVGDTLVAPDLETATRWAYEYGKRWRVVTMDGNLIELSGTMQGGGRSLRRGGMRLESQGRNSSGSGGGSGGVDPLADGSQEECDKLEAQAEQAQAQLMQCRNKRRKIAGEIRTLQKKIKELTVEIPKLSVKVASCDTTREELTKQLPEMRQLCILSEDDASKLEELTQKVDQCQLDMASCAKHASALEADVARLQASILNAGGARLKKQQKVCDKALADLNDATTKLNSTKVQMTASLKAAAKAKTAREVGEQEFEKCSAELKDKKEQFQKLQDEAYEVHQAYEKVQALEAEKREALESVSKEVEGLKKIQGKLKCNEVELVAKLDACEKTLHDIAGKESHWEKQLEKLREAEQQDIDENDEDDYDDDEEESDIEEEGEQTKSSNAESGSANGDSDDGDDDVEMEDISNDGDEGKGKGEGDSPQIKKRTHKKSPLPIFNEQALDQYDRDEVKEDIQTLENERKAMAKNANMAAIAEYKKKEEDYLMRVSELDKVTGERNEARKNHEDLRRQRLEKFMEGFGQISLKLKEMYQMITLGGDAELELVDSLDPFSEGIVFSVRPPNKSWKNISNLSGGEKTLSSLALVFALHHYKPTPLYVMDEIDAALDFRNVSIVANYIKERTKNAQFIIISLRNNMFELADRLVGIYKTNNCTKSITISPKAFSNKGAPREAGPLNDRTNEGTASSEMRG